MLFWVTAEIKNIRGVAKDNVGRNSQDDIRSALIMNIPGGKKNLLYELRMQ